MSDIAASMKKLVVATDLSDQADRAVERALQLAAMHGAEIDVIHVLEEDVPAEAQSEFQDRRAKEIEGRLSAMPFANVVTVTISLVAGRPAPDIVERARLFGADCIVLGLHDRILEENLAIEGTLAESIIRESRLPVLLVKAESSEPYASAVIGVDFSPFSTAAIRSAALVAPQARLSFVHAYEPEGGSVSAEDEAAKQRQELEAFVNDQREALKRSADEAGLSEITIDLIARPGEPRETLKAEIERLGADLVVLGTHGRTGLTRTLFGSTATDIINQRPCDILVICPE